MRMDCIFFKKYDGAISREKSRPEQKFLFSRRAEERQEAYLQPAPDNACIIAGPAASFSTRKLEASYADRKG